MSKSGVITFLDYKVNKVFYELNDEYNGEEVDVDFEIETEINVSEDNEEMIVVLGVDIFKKVDEKVYPFHMFVELEGYFKSNLQPGEEIAPYSKNAIAILFPYVRALVSTYTANANVTPLILPTINVNKLLDKKSNSIAETK